MVIKDTVEKSNCMFDSRLSKRQPRFCRLSVYGLGFSSRICGGGFGTPFVKDFVEKRACLLRKELIMIARRETPTDMLDREFNRVWNRFWGSGEVPSTLAPYAVDVHEDADHFYVEAELPGFTQEETEITLEDGVLTIRAERKTENKNGASNRQPLHMERRWTRFERSFTLPAAVNENSVHATLEGGLLTITLDKREEVKPRKIQIKAGAPKAGNGLNATNSGTGPVMSGQ
jgi:HSP20 family protein